MFLAPGIFLPSALVFPAPSVQEEQQTEPVELPAPRPMTVDDSLDMDSVGGALMSPGGEWVLFSKNQLDWDENERNTKWYMIPSSGGEAFEYIGDEGGGSFQFSPDGKYLTLSRSVDGDRQIYWMRTAGGEAVQLTKHETSIGSYQWSEDSKRIFFVATDERPDDESTIVNEDDDVVFVDEGPNGQNRSYWSNLWVFDVENHEITQITDEEFVLGGFDVSPDSARIAFSARYTNRRNDADKNEIYVVELSSGAISRLTDNNAPESVAEWSPDGKMFTLTAADDKEWMNRNTKIWLLDPVLGEHQLLSGGFEGSPRGAVWTPEGGHLLFSGQQGANTNLFRMDAQTGEFEKLTNFQGSMSISSWSADRTQYVYSFSDYDTPADLWVGFVDGSEPVRLTHANPQIDELQLAEMRVIQWESHDGMMIEGLLHLPIGYEEGDLVPLILNIHGGPAGSFTNSFRASYHIHAGLGYASLSPNVRGSSGYTDYLREGNTFARGDGIGFGDFQDLMTGVDKVIADAIVDPTRMGVRGWSYGGILGGWTITQTDRFKAASIGAGVYDWTSEYGPGFNNDVRLWHIGGTPWDNGEAWRNQSALTHVNNIVTPTLLIHGANDTTDTEQQSMMFFTAIKDIGKAPVRYIKFPREPHGFREPKHQRIRDIEEIRWMQQYVLGMEWEPWERPEKGEEGEKEDES
jgi:dipeptidyl aminopeptidase/acylaminoacyl peptidase|tara:strand:+ start:8423 stop:10492 length:2070 start_codon:yes stop_codon:yes gene_type:complete